MTVTWGQSISYNAFGKIAEWRGDLSGPDIGSVEKNAKKGVACIAFGAVAVLSFVEMAARAVYLFVLKGANCLFSQLNDAVKQADRNVGSSFYTSEAALEVIMEQNWQDAKIDDAMKVYRHVLHGRLHRAEECERRWEESKATK